MFLCMLFSAVQIFDKSACSAMSSVVFADLFGRISVELLPLMISGVPSHSPIFQPLRFDAES